MRGIKVERGREDQRPPGESALGQTQYPPGLYPSSEQGPAEKPTWEEQDEVPDAAEAEKKMPGKWHTCLGSKATPEVPATSPAFMG